MSAEQNEIKSAIRLPSVLRNRIYGTQEASRMKRRAGSWSATFSETKRRQSQESFMGVSSAAAGGDLLFAESCVQLEIPLRVLLPLPRNASAMTLTQLPGCASSRY